MKFFKIKNKPIKIIIIPTTFCKYSILLLGIECLTLDMAKEAINGQNKDPKIIPKIKRG